MANTKSAKKAIRSSARKREINLSRLSKIRNAIREYKNFLKNNKYEEAKKALSEVFKQVDKAAKTNLYHKNKAARIKSRMSKKLSLIKTEVSLNK